MRWAIIAIGLAAIWFGLFESDWLDRRPVERVLFLGDSYTYHNDMPAMVAEMADSAGSDRRYAITMQAFGGATLEDHWNHAGTRSLLAQGSWDRVLIQPESYFQRLDGDHMHFRFARRLLDAAGRARPAIVVSWTGSEVRYQGAPVSRREHFRNIERNHRALSSRTGAQLIDVARVWDDVVAEPLPFSLYKEDGNHPSLEGSYLAALVVFAALTGADVGAVTYVPWRMSDDRAALLRERVQRSLRADALTAPTLAATSAG